MPLSDRVVENLRLRYINDQEAISVEDLEDLAMQTSLVASQLGGLMEVFDLLEPDATRRINNSHIAKLLEAVGRSMTEQEVGEMLERGQFPPNPDGFYFEEFGMLVRTQVLDLAEVLAYIELTTTPSIMGVPRSKRRAQAVEKQQTILKKIWNEITSPEMALKSGKKSPAPAEAAQPPPVVSVSNVEGDAVSSADAAASVATTAATTLPGPTQLVRGEYTSIHSGDELMQLLNDNPTDAFVLMVGFSFCRPCKAFQRIYAKMAAHYTNVHFLLVYGNENESTTTLVKDVLQLKVSPMFYFFRGNSTGLKPVHAHSGAKDQKLVDALYTFLTPEEVPEDGHYNGMRKSNANEDSE